MFDSTTTTTTTALHWLDGYVEYFPKEQKEVFQRTHGNWRKDLHSTYVRNRLIKGSIHFWTEIVPNWICAIAWLTQRILMKVVILRTDRYAWNLATLKWLMKKYPLPRKTSLFHFQQQQFTIYSRRVDLHPRTQTARAAAAAAFVSNQFSTLH